jgi:hypothetical protein
LDFSQLHSEKWLVYAETLHTSLVLPLPNHLRLILPKYLPLILIDNFVRGLIEHRLVTFYYSFVAATVITEDKVDEELVGVVEENVEFFTS